MDTAAPVHIHSVPTSFAPPRAYSPATSAATSAHRSKSNRNKNLFTNLNTTRIPPVLPVSPKCFLPL